MNANDVSNLRMRGEIVDAYVTVIDDSARFWQIVSSTDGDEDAVVAALGAAFGLGVHGARAVFGMQVRNFTPERVAQIRSEQADVRAALARHEA